MTDCTTWVSFWKLKRYKLQRVQYITTTCFSREHTSCSGGSELTRNMSSELKSDELWRTWWGMWGGAFGLLRNMWAVWAQLDEEPQSFVWELQCSGVNSVQLRSKCWDSGWCSNSTSPPWRPTLHSFLCYYLPFFGHFFALKGVMNTPGTGSCTVRPISWAMQRSAPQAPPLAPCTEALLQAWCITTAAETKQRGEDQCCDPHRRDRKRMWCHTSDWGDK